MRVFVAGASGAIGRPLIAQLIRRGHTVTGMTRSEVGVRHLAALGAIAAQVIAFDAPALDGRFGRHGRKSSSTKLTALLGFLVTRGCCRPSGPGCCEVGFIERILRHLGLWQEGVRVHSGTDPPGEKTLDPWLDDPFPDYDTEPIVAPPPETSGSARVRLSHPLFQRPPALRRQLLTSRPTFVTLRSWKRTLSASDSGPTPRRAKSNFLSVQFPISY